MSIVTNIQAGGLAVTGADPMPWWVWAIAGALVVLGIVFVLLRRRGADDADDAPAASSTEGAVADTTGVDDAGDGSAGDGAAPDAQP